MHRYDVSIWRTSLIFFQDEEVVRTSNLTCNILSSSSITFKDLMTEHVVALCAKSPRRTRLLKMHVKQRQRNHPRRGKDISRGSMTLLICLSLTESLQRKTNNWVQLLYITRSVLSSLAELSLTQRISTQKRHDSADLYNSISCLYDGPVSTAHISSIRCTLVLTWARHKLSIRENTYVARNLPMEMRTVLPFYNSHHWDRLLSTRSSCRLSLEQSWIWIGIHFHPKTHSSTDTFIQKRFHPNDTFVRIQKDTFIQKIFLPRTVSSTIILSLKF